MLLESIYVSNNVALDFYLILSNKIWRKDKGDTCWSFISWNLQFIINYGTTFNLLLYDLLLHCLVYQIYMGALMAPAIGRCIYPNIKNNKIKNGYWEVESLCKTAFSLTLIKEKLANITKVYP